MAKNAEEAGGSSSQTAGSLIPSSSEQILNSELAANSQSKYPYRISFVGVSVDCSLHMKVKKLRAKRARVVWAVTPTNEDSNEREGAN